MKFKTYLSIIFLLSVFFSRAQQPLIDSLEGTISKSIADSLRITTYLELSDKYGSRNTDVAIYLSNKALLLAQKIQDTGRICASQAELAWNYYAMGNYPVALECYYAALNLQENKGDLNGIASTIGGIGQVYWRQGNLSKALTSFYKALSLYQQLGKKSGVAKALGSIANVQIDLAKKEKKPEAIESAWQKALEYSFKSLKIREVIGEKRLISTALGNIGIIYHEYGKTKQDKKDSLYSMALNYYTKALKLDEELENKEGISRHLGNMGSLCIRLGKYSEAETHLKHALLLSKELKSQVLIRDQHNYLFILYDSLIVSSQKYNKSNGYTLSDLRYLAYKHYKSYVELRDTILNEEREKQSLRSELNYEFEKKELAAKAEQQRRELLMKEEKQKHKIITWSIILFALLVIVFALFLFKRYRVTQRQKKLIEKQKVIVDEAFEKLHEKNKEVLDSIHYAKRIQSSLLTSERYIDKSILRLKGKNS